MAALLEGVFTSKLFTFVVGPSKKAIVIHAEIVAKQSVALNALINGQWSESQCGSTEFDDVQEETFIRFCQFAYTGDYVTPSFIYSVVPRTLSTSSVTYSSRSPSMTRSNDDTLPAQVEVELAETAVRIAEAAPEPVVEVESVTMEEITDTWATWGTVPSKKAKKKALSKSRILRKEFDRMGFDQSSDSCDTEPCEVRVNETSEEDYTPVFLGHAHLYVFAEKWGIEGLKTLTLRKMHRTLSTFTLFEARRRDIIELISFVYSNNETPDLENEIDALRGLIIHYVTCELEALVEAPEFLVLLEQPGLFARDLVKMMMRRIE